MGFAFHPSSARTDSTERHWELHFAEFFFSGAAQPLYLYATERNGQWITVIGSSRSQANSNHKTYNRAYYCGDLSGASIEDGRMKGRLTLHMTPDQWVPLNHKSYTIEVDVDVAIAGENAEGNYKVVAVNSTDETAQQFKGRTGVVTGADQARQTIRSLNPIHRADEFAGRCVGGAPEFGEHCMVVRLGVDGRKVTAANVGRLSATQDVSAITAFDVAVDVFSILPDGFKGRLQIEHSGRRPGQIPIRY